MDYPKEHSTSLYDYSDKSAPQAGYAAIAYGVISLFTGLLALIQYLLYHRPAHSSLLDHDYASQQWLQHTPLLTVLMLLLVMIPQLYIWFIVHSIAGSLVSIVVTAFLIRGALRIFERPEEDQVSTPNV
jgi:hypothetical protein